VSPSRNDTLLARALHAQGRHPLSELLRCLNQVRGARESDPEMTLASILVREGVLSAEEVERLLAEATPLAESAPTDVATSWRPGGQVGDYSLHELLGQGGTGVVYRARHNLSGREVALKGVTLPDDHPDALTRFQREAKAQSAVDTHPNVIRIYDVGLVAQGGYLAMELATGGDLCDRLRSGPLPEREAARLIAQLASGLAHVHELGILHRDLKPANVLLSDDGTPKLVDFGLASLSEGGSRITRTGELLGTPAYMAPEQAGGEHERIDVRTDVYALGAVLYELLTGRMPFQGVGLIDTLIKVISEEPTPPSTLRSDLHPELEAICLKAMAKDPDERYQRAASLGEALEAWGSGKEGAALPEAKGVRGILLLTLLVAALSFGAGYAARGGRSPLPVGETSPAPSGASSPAASPATPSPGDKSEGPPTGMRGVWSLDRPPTVRRPALWEEVGSIADPLGGRERSGWLEQAFSGDARALAGDRVAVRYSPGRGLVMRIAGDVANLVRGDVRMLSFQPSGDAFTVLAPNDAGPLTALVGSGLWEDAALSLRCEQRPIDQGAISIRLAEGGISYVAREASLLAGGTRAPLEWGNTAHLLELTPKDTLPLRLDGKPVPGLDVSAKGAPGVTPRLTFSEGQWRFKEVVLSGRCLRPDRPALCWAPTSLKGAAGGLSLRFQGAPTSGGGPVVTLGPLDGLRVSAEVLKGSLVLRLGRRVLRQVGVPALESGTLSLVRRGDRFSADLSSGETHAQLSAEVPERLPGALRAGYGSTGPRVVCLAVTAWQGAADDPRSAYDAATDPMKHLEGAASPRTLWWLGVELLRPLLDPAQAGKLAPIGPQGQRVERAQRALTALRTAAQGLEHPSARLDASCRALFAAVFAGDVQVARALVVEIASVPRAAEAARETLAGVRQGAVKALAGGFRAMAEDPNAAEAALVAAEPLLSHDAERTALHLGWARLLTRRRGEVSKPPTPAQRATFKKIFEHLQAAQRTAAGPNQRYSVNTRLARFHESIGPFEDWERHMRLVLVNPVGAGYPNNWHLYATNMGRHGKHREAVEAYVGAAVRDRKNSKRRAQILRALKSAPPSPCCAAVALYALACLEAGERWTTHSWGREAVAAARAALAQSTAPPRDQDLARYVLRRAGLSVPPSDGKDRPTQVLLRESPPPADLARAATEDLLVGSLIRLDPRLSPLLRAR
jgi:hypothetical protein